MHIMHKETGTQRCLLEPAAPPFLQELGSRLLHVVDAADDGLGKDGHFVIS